MQTEVLKWTISFILGGAVSLCGTTLAMWRQRRKKTRALEDGVQCLLRAEIIRSYEKYTEKEFAPLYAKETIKRAYCSYHDLGGNDVATTLYDKIMKLPTEIKNNHK